MTIETYETDTPSLAPIAAAGPNPAAVYLARLAAGSRRTMRQALDAIARYATDGRADALTMPWQQLRYIHTQAIRAHLLDNLAVSTANKHLSALRGVLKEAWRLGLIPADEYQRAVDVANGRGSRLPAGRHVDLGEVSALVAVCSADPQPAGARDAAMLAVSFGAGLRLSELTNLDLADLNAETGELKVRGKGDKERTAWLAGGALSTLTDWLAVRGTSPGALFCPIRKGGKIVIRPFTGQAVYARFNRRAQDAGLALRFSPHDGRRTWIGNLLDAGADISTVQQMAGHVSVSTTQRYDRRGERAKKSAAQLLHFPWQPRQVHDPSS
jgi:site-specific recombinase XerC